jgi:hypothetical protein
MRTSATIPVKSLVLTIMLAALMGFAIGPAQAQTPSKNAKLVAASIVFHTTDHSKPADTAVSVTLSRAGVQIAQVRDLTGRFDSNSTDGPFALDVTTPITTDQLPGLIATVSFVPKKTETWKFNYTMRLTFSDGTKLVREINDVVLTQDTRSRVQTLTPTA